MVTKLVKYLAKCPGIYSHQARKYLAKCSYYTRFTAALHLFFVKKTTFSFIFLYLFQKFLFLNFHKHDIRSDILNTCKWNHEFTVRAEESTDFPRPRYNNCPDLSVAWIEIHIHHTAEPLAVTAVYDLFFSQFTKSHRGSPLCIRTAFLVIICGFPYRRYTKPLLCQVLIYFIKTPFFFPGNRLQ